MMTLGHNTLAPTDRIFMRVGRGWGGGFNVYFRLTRFVGSGRPDEYTEALSRLQTARNEALVERDPVTAKLKAKDLCRTCGQHFIYLDIERMQAELG